MEARLGDRCSLASLPRSARANSGPFGPAGLQSAEPGPSRGQARIRLVKEPVHAFRLNAIPGLGAQIEADVAVRSSCTTCGSSSVGADASGS